MQPPKFNLIQPNTSVIIKCQEFCRVMGEMSAYYVRMNSMFKGKGVFADMYIRFLRLNLRQGSNCPLFGKVWNCLFL